MSYFFKINNNDYSMYVNKLQVGTERFYNTSPATAAGYQRINYLYTKRVLEVGIIPLDDAAMIKLMGDIHQNFVTVSFRDPATNTLVENMNCILPSDIVEYYTIQAGNVKYKALSLQFQEVLLIGGGA